MASNKEKSLGFILGSIITLITNSTALLVARFAFEPSEQKNSIDQIFNIICGSMIFISIIGLIYGILLRKKT